MAPAFLNALLQKHEMLVYQLRELQFIFTCKKKCYSITIHLLQWCQKVLECF